MTTRAERPESLDMMRDHTRSQSLLHDADLTRPESSDDYRSMKQASLPDSFGNLLLFDSKDSGNSVPDERTDKTKLPAKDSFSIADKNNDQFVDWKELCFFDAAGMDGLLSKSEFESYQKRLKPLMRTAPDAPVASPIGRIPVNPPADRLAEHDRVHERADKGDFRPDVAPVKDSKNTERLLPPGKNFDTRDGKIFAPDGKPFVAAGFAMYTRNAKNEDNIAQAIAMKPNIIRLAADPDKDSPLEIQKIIDKFTSNGIVVEVEDHASGNKVEGAKLEKVAGWYSDIARKNVDNPLVWFGTPNEPNQDPENFVKTEKTIYDAIRSAGNKNMIMLQVNYNKTGVQPILDQSEVYGKMDNTVIDHHMYSSRPDASALLKSALEKEGRSGMPVIVGEFGNSTRARVEHDQSFNAIMDANGRGEVGAIAWAWENPGSIDKEANAMFDRSGRLTSYGARIRNWLASRLSEQLAGRNGSG